MAPAPTSTARGAATVRSGESLDENAWIPRRELEMLSAKPDMKKRRIRPNGKARHRQYPRVLPVTCTVKHELRHEIGLSAKVIGSTAVGASRQPSEHLGPGEYGAFQCLPHWEALPAMGALELRHWRLRVDGIGDGIADLLRMLVGQASVRIRIETADQRVVERSVVVDGRNGVLASDWAMRRRSGIEGRSSRVKFSGAWRLD